MRCDVVIKTWRNDLCWLSYCLRFLAKNWLANGRTIILADDNCRQTIQGWNSREDVFYVKPWPDGYSHAMVTKATADEYSDAELILLVDSDTMLTEPARPESLMMGDGLPVIRYRDYASFEKEYPHAPWRRVVEQLFLTRPSFYYTYLPALYWRSSFQAMRRHLARLHHCSFLELTYSPTPFDPKNFANHPISFADHEALGFYCWLAEHDRYVFMRADTWNFGGAKCYHSWTQWNEKTRAELENLLEKS